MFWNIIDNIDYTEVLQERMYRWLCRHKYIHIPPIKKRQGQKKVCIHYYENLGVLSKDFYIKGYGVNWYSKLNVSLNSLKCKDTSQ